MSAKKPTQNLHRPTAAKHFSPHALLVLALSALALACWTADRLWPRQMHAAVQPGQLGPKFHGRQIALPFSDEVAAAEIATFDDQLEAFLRYEYLRGCDPDDASKSF